MRCVLVYMCWLCGVYVLADACIVVLAVCTCNVYVFAPFAIDVDVDVANGRSVGRLLRN